MADRFLRVKDVAKMFGVCTATVWNWSKRNPDFPKPHKLTNKTTGWRLSELNRYMEDHLFV